MCGINGIFAYNSAALAVDREELLRTREHMFARGPDGCGIWISQDERLGLGHRRLAIIDPSDMGAQPMATENGRFHIVFNGEIYNYKVLRQKLIEDGISFRTRTDTEVLLYLYQRYGEAMVHQLRGMFAFAIWDEVGQELFLARDPYGIKPLYYSDNGRVFRFASQVKALQAGGAISRELEPAGVTGFLLWGSVPEHFTLYKDIYALPAGSIMRVNQRGAAVPKKYWCLAEVIAHSCEVAASIPHDQECEYLRDVLLDSVKAHMVADVPVGAFLSAGLDSSTVVGLAREVSNNSLETFTLTFDEFRGKVIDEFPIATQIAQHLGVQQHCVIAGIQEFEAEFSDFLAAMDQPTIDGLNTWFVSKAASEAGLKVALSGLGGDELFGGYPSFNRIPHRVQNFATYSRIPFLGDTFRILYSSLLAPYTPLSPKYAGLLKYGGTYEGAYQLERGLFMPWELNKLLKADFARQGLSALQAHKEEKLSAKPTLTGFGKVVELESSRYMRNQLLRDTDWVGMAHSLEIRVPLVDRILMEKVVGLAATGRLGKGKSILPRTLSRGLPEQALKRGKTGFTIPIWRWLQKSTEIDAWKRIKALRKPNMRSYHRLAYSLLSRMTETRGILK